MCQVLNMSDFWTFVNFCKYDRILNIRWDAIREGFWIFHDSEYVRFLHNASVTQGIEYGWIMSYGRVLNMPVQNLQGFKKASGSKYARAQNMARLWIWKGYTGCWICLHLPEYALIMCQYVWICFNNAEYD